MSRRLIRSLVLVALVIAPTTAGAGDPPGQAPPLNVVPPSISGTTQLGSALGASTGTWSGKALGFAYQWQRCDSTGGSCAAVAGARSTSYTLVAAEVGYTLRVVVTATNKNGSASATSAATALVAPAPATSPPPPTSPTPPSWSSPPAISGTAQQGQTLSASPGIWSGSTPMAYAYQWQRCAGTCGPISGATASAYLLVQGDVGATIRVAVSASNAAGSATATSASTAAVTTAPAPAPQPTGSPYWRGNFSSGAYCQFSTVFESTSVNTALSSWGGLPACPNYTPYALDPSQRVFLTHSPAPPTGAASTWVSHQEVRSTDGPWMPGYWSDKSTIRTTTQQTLNGSALLGQTRWFRYSFYLPNPGFNWPSNSWYDLMDLHNTVKDPAGNDWPTIETMVTPSGNPRYVALSMDGTTARAAYEEAKLLQLTDASGNRLSSAFNRWHTVIMGVKFSDQGSVGNSPGRVTIYFDGSLVYDKARPNVWAGETGVYLTLQNYKRHDAGFANGAASSTVDFADARIGYTLADVSG